MFKEMSFGEIQRKAEDLLSFNGFDQIRTLPLNIEKLARLMKIQIVPMDGLKKEYGIKGCVVKCSKGFSILLDSYHYERQEESSVFTIGEEVGHIILHLNDVEDVTTINEWMHIVVCNENYRAYIEQQARVFSSNLLLPRYAFEPYTLDWVKRNIKSLKKFQNFSVDDLAFNIGASMADELRVSSWIIEITLKRWPDRIIDKVFNQFNF